jgi:hypothetical protein
MKARIDLAAPYHLVLTVFHNGNRQTFVLFPDGWAWGIRT